MGVPLLTPGANRYYDPSVGRCTQQDSLPGFQQDPQSLDQYAFVEGDPINLLGLAGMCSHREKIGNGALVAGATVGVAAAVVTAPPMLGGSLIGAAGLTFTGATFLAGKFL